MRLLPTRAAKRESAFLSSPLAVIRDELDRTFDRFMTGWPMSETALSKAEWIPTLDVSETDTDVMVRVDVPGIDPKALEVSLTGDILTIAGERRDEKENKDENYYMCERSFGSFRRSIELPTNIDPDSVSAEHSNGVVSIRIAKARSARPKQVTIKPTTKAT